MKTKAILVWTLIVLLITGASAWEWYMGYQAKQTLAYLFLADDASDPQVKADYLREFLTKVGDKNVPEYAAFLFPTERLSTKQQRAVIMSLIKRCEETAKLPRESFGFAQGMSQLTGQEFDHSLGEICSIYKKALCIRFGFFWYYFFIWVFLGSIGLTIYGLYLSSEAWDWN